MPTLLIDSNNATRQYWRDLWQYRELFAYLAWRDLLVRYKQTVVGVAWSVIRPLLTMLILTFVFGRVSKLPSGDVPYPILVLCGILPWQFFSTALAESGNSLVTNSNLISKVYFPRLIIPTSSILTGIVDFLVTSVFLGCLLVWYQHCPPLAILFLPLFTLLVVLTSLGAGLWIAALMVKYRDFRFIVPFIVQFGLYISPVGFQSNVVSERFQLLYSLNPMVGAIDGFRWCILGNGHTLSAEGLSLSVLSSCTLLISGLWYFRKTEKGFADII